MPRPHRKQPPVIRWCSWCGETLTLEQNTFCDEDCAEDYSADVWREARQRASAAAAAALGESIAMNEAGKRYKALKRSRRRAKNRSAVEGLGPPPQTRAAPAGGRQAADSGRLFGDVWPGALP